MKSSCRIALLAALSTLVVSPAARARALADPRFATYDAVVVGSPLGLAINQAGDPGNPGFDVTVRAIDNSPVPGAFVSLDFTGAGITLYTSQNSGTTIDCAQESIHRLTNAQGQAKFAAQMGRWQDANLVSLQVEGVEMAKVKARSMDYGGDGRVSIVDLDVFALDFLGTPSTMRSDFDVSGSTGLGDLSIFSVHYLGSIPKPLCMP